MAEYWFAGLSARAEEDIHCVPDWLSTSSNDCGPAIKGFPSFQLSHRMLGLDSMSTSRRVVLII